MPRKRRHRGEDSTYRVCHTLGEEEMTEPQGCAECGQARRGHGYRGSPGHYWKAPTQDQIKERMKARRLTRLMMRIGTPSQSNLLANAPHLVCPPDAPQA